MKLIHTTYIHYLNESINNNTIYHYTSQNNINNILKDDELKIMDWGYVSFTKNGKLNWDDIRIDFYYDKLNKDYNLKEYQYDDTTWAEQEGMSEKELIELINNFKQEQELISITNVKNLSKYIKQIIFNKNSDYDKYKKIKNTYPKIPMYYLY